jgi:WD40 repeat protein
MIASGSWDKTVRVWDAATGEPALGGPLEGHGGPVVSVAWSPDGTMIASGSMDETVRVWDAATGKPALGGPLEGHGCWVVSVAWSPDGTIIISTDFGDEVLVWNAATGEQVPRDPGLPQPTQQGVPSAMPLECRGAVVPVPIAGGGADGASEGIAFTCESGATKATWMSVAPTKRNNAGQPHSAVACVIVGGKSVVVLHLIGEAEDGGGEGKEGKA